MYVYLSCKCIGSFVFLLYTILLLYSVCILQKINCKKSNKLTFTQLQLAYFSLDKRKLVLL